MTRHQRSWLITGVGVVLLVGTALLYTRLASLATSGASASQRAVQQALQAGTDLGATPPRPSRSKIRPAPPFRWRSSAAIRWC